MVKKSMPMDIHLGGLDLRSKAEVDDVHRHDFSFLLWVRANAFS